MSSDIILDIIGGLIGAISGFLSAVLYNYITKFLERREQKKVRDKSYINLYKAFKIIDNRVQAKIQAFICFRNVGLERFSEDMDMLVNQFYKPEGNLTVNTPNSLVIKVDDVRWILILSFDQYIIIDKANDQKRFDYDKSNQSNREVLINFLEDLENRYKKAKVIKSNKLLLLEEEKQLIREFQ